MTRKIKYKKALLCLAFMIIVILLGSIVVFYPSITQAYTAENKETEQVIELNSVKIDSSDIINSHEIIGGTHSSDALENEIVLTDTGYWIKSSSNQNNIKTTDTQTTEGNTAEDSPLERAEYKSLDDAEKNGSITIARSKIFDEYSTEYVSVDNNDCYIKYTGNMNYIELSSIQISEDMNSSFEFGSNFPNSIFNTSTYQAKSSLLWTLFETQDMVTDKTITYATVSIGKFVCELSFEGFEIQKIYEIIDSLDMSDYYNVVQ